MANSLKALQKQDEPKMTFSQYLADERVKLSITQALGDAIGSSKFIGNLASVVSLNPALQDCEFKTVVSAGLLANSLKLSMSPAIGHCYIIPFKDTKNKKVVATFVLGWKGYVQLAERSGYYEKINVIAIKEGEVVKIDNINEEYIFMPIQDDEEREKAPTVGYFAYFRYNEAHGGFYKAIYWSKKKMLKHADKYSKAFYLNAVENPKDPTKNRVSYEDFVAGKFPQSEAWKYSSYWYSDFDGMALKTLIRQLIGKWGIMSVDFQKAYEADGGYMDEMSVNAPIQYGDENDGATIAILSEQNKQDTVEGKTVEGEVESAQEDIQNNFFND